jgi:hypothetical protein
MLCLIGGSLTFVIGAYAGFGVIQTHGDKATTHPYQPVAGGNGFPLYCTGAHCVELKLST